MIICFNCTSETKSKLDDLLNSGNYMDYGEVIAIAVNNLTVLSKEVISKGSVIIGENVDLPDSPERVLRRKEPERRIDLKQRAPLESIPEIFKLTGNYDVQPLLSEIPADEGMPEADIPPQYWTFGQHNRLLPVKASCRALANLHLEYFEGIPLEIATNKIAQAAAQLGKYLEEIDKRLDLKRGEAFSTAFPLSSNNRERAILRYSTQFVANATKSGELTGALYDLKLINKIPGSGFNIALTEPGWQFGILRNPVFDNPGTTSPSRFSDDEMRVFLDHILNNVPREREAYIMLLKMMSNGINEPDSVDDELTMFADQTSQKKYKRSFIRTQRSGAISRMSDLGLVIREKDGIRVSYKISRIGNEFLEGVSK